MRKLLVGFVLGVATAAAASALAVTGQMLPLSLGQSAYIEKQTPPIYAMGRTVCAAVVKRGQPTFNCYVTDGQNVKRFGVSINPVEVTAYSNLRRDERQRTRVLFRRTQGTLWVIR